MKRILDLFFSIVLIICTSPILLIAAIGIICTSGFPVLFIQKRVGENNRIFNIYKLRTMNRNSSAEDIHSVSRVTKWGRYLRLLNIDELPQLFNILKGDMSFIGPRPLLVEYLQLYSSEQIKRHNVRPGLTGLAQINGRNTQSWEERFEWDIKYIKSASLKLDGFILLKTFKLLFKKQTVNSSSTLIMEPFKGQKEV